MRSISSAISSLENSSDFLSLEAMNNENVPINIVVKKIAQQIILSKYVSGLFNARAPINEDIAPPMKIDPIV